MSLLAMANLSASYSGVHSASATVAFPTNDVFAVTNLSTIEGDFESLAAEGFFAKQAPAGMDRLIWIRSYVDSYEVKHSYYPAVGKEMEKINDCTAVTFTLEVYARRHAATATGAVFLVPKPPKLSTSTEGSYQAHPPMSGFDPSSVAPPDQTLVLFDPRSGAVLHTHRVMYVPGAVEVDLTALTDRAKQATRRVHRLADNAELGVLVTEQPLPAGQGMRIEPRTQELIVTPDALPQSSAKQSAKKSWWRR